MVEARSVNVKTTTTTTTGMIMEKESIYITDGIENASLSLHYIGIWGDSLSNVGLLNIDNTTSVNREKMYLVFLSMSAACVLCVFSSHSFWTSNSLDIPAGVTQEEGHTGFLIHLLSAVRALIFLARRNQPFLSLIDPEVMANNI